MRLLEPDVRRVVDRAVEAAQRLVPGDVARPQVEDRLEDGAHRVGTVEQRQDLLALLVGACRPADDLPGTPVLGAGVEVGLVELPAPLAAALGGVHREVGAAQELLGRLVAQRAHDNADARGRRDRLAAGGQRLGDGGNVEGSLTGWSLTGGAAAVAGGAPAVTGAPAGTKSLLIPSGGSVTSAPMCVAAHSPFFRLQARNTGIAGALKVEVLYLDGPRYTGERETGYVTGGTAWAPTNRLSLAQGIMGVNGSSTSQATVAFRFTPVGTGGKWQVDDLYVDPYRRF